MGRSHTAVRRAIAIAAVCLAGSALVPACGSRSGAMAVPDVTVSAATSDSAWVYTKALPILEKQPSLWGGAHVEDDRLVIEYVGQTAADAQRSLEAAGVPGNYVLRAGAVSTQTLDAQLALVQKYIARNPNGHVVQAGPDYSEGTLVIGLYDDDGTAEKELLELLAGSGPAPRFEAVDSRPSLG